MPVGTVLRMIFVKYGQLLWGPGLGVLLLVLALTTLVSARGRRMERQMLGKNRRPLFRDVGGNILLGLAGGFAGSLVFTFAGISVDFGAATVSALWTVVFLLMLIDFRFVCFSYAGSVIALLSLVTGWPKCNVPGLMALVAVLHGIEALLITASGGRDAVPVYVRRGNKLVGGFILQKVWPIAAVLLMGQAGARAGSISAPHWWPLIRSNVAVLPGEMVTYFLVPLIVVLGYSDMTTAMEPADKARSTGALLGLYSFCLLALSILAVGHPGVALVAVLFGALGHEAVIQISKRVEWGSNPRFTSPRAGIGVLDVMPGSAAERMGIGRGDVVLRVNGDPVADRHDLETEMGRGSLLLDVEILREGRTVTLQHSGAATHLGIVPVPGPGDTTYVEVQNGGLFSRAQRWLRGRARRAV